MSLQTAIELERAGRFREALQALEASRGAPAEHVALEVLKTELLQVLGRFGEARERASTLLKRSDRLSQQHRCACEAVLGYLAREEANLDGAIGHFQRSVTAGRLAKDLGRVCRAQTALVAIVSDRYGPDAAAPLIAELRANTTKLGDPHTTVALHLFVGEAEAKRGLLKRAGRHAHLALSILSETPNYWLESMAENLLLAICLMRSDLRAALPHGLKAADLAEKSGSAVMCRASLGNLGNLYYLLGEFDKATDYFEKGVNSLRSNGDTKNWSLESSARVRLSQDRLDECEHLLDEIERSIKCEEDRRLFAHRYAAMARALLLARKGRMDDAMLQIDGVLALTDVTGDRLLGKHALIMKADLLQQSGAVDEFRDVVDKALGDTDTESPEVFAHYESTLAAACLAENHIFCATTHHDRAMRICKATANVPAQIDVINSWNRVTAQHMLDRACADVSALPDATEASGPAIQSVCSLLANASYPEIVGRELFALLKVSGATQEMTLSVRKEGVTESLDSFVSPPFANRQSKERTFVIGSIDDRTVELSIRPGIGADSIATINAVSRLLQASDELQRARAERQERAPLWPADNPNVNRDGAVVSGRMRELMTFAQRVARTTVSVLITGESGTGKEILARAIHTYSDRALKPFVPVNCAAIPRELLESYLFGHRRGAFTGADRDHTGFIRAARDGTLFLDEVGELGLDLQPKLLRFLESGEISPLGEPTPLTVNVRIVAATNRNLEDLVRDGRFREDLFYRLNVVPLAIPPLRERRDEVPGMVQYFVQRAAEEFRKGHLTVAEETMERLLLYRWPGNVRQLHNELRRMVALVEPNATLLPDMISEDILGAMPLLRPGHAHELAVSLTDKLPLALRKIESEMIKLALREHRGKVDAAARALGISRKGLYLKRQRLGL
jgi:transcriptional regulator with PAS, ATPase and Fis domain/tetratricopeptide (TPR) repeat protein